MEEFGQNFRVVTYDRTAPPEKAYTHIDKVRVTVETESSDEAEEAATKAMTKWLTDYRGSPHAVTHVLIIDGRKAKQEMEGAAPDLLAACEAAEEWIDEHVAAHYYGEGQRKGEILDGLQQAIAEAKGGKTTP